MITRTGTHPILKYTAKVWGHHVIFIDDDEGNLLIDSDRGLAFKHWWGFDGRGKCSLREFLVTAPVGYIKDKLSYGLSRWDGEKALKELNKACSAAWGNPDEWPIEISDTIELLNERLSEDAFGMALSYCREFCTMFPPGEFPYSGAYANKEVDMFVDRVWPELVDFWSKELKNEGIR